MLRRDPSRTYGLERRAMLVIIALSLVLTALVLAWRARDPARVNAANLGWMSERWIAEYRARRT
jgi:hypothetical protein